MPMKTALWRFIFPGNFRHFLRRCSLRILLDSLSRWDHLVFLSKSPPSRLSVGHDYDPLRRPPQLLALSFVGSFKEGPACYTLQSVL